jgi:hypothetical protein
MSATTCDVYTAAGQIERSMNQRLAQLEGRLDRIEAQLDALLKEFTFPTEPAVNGQMVAALLNYVNELSDARYA